MATASKAKSKRATPVRSLHGDLETGSKLAAVVANRIARDIAALGWPEGHVLGSEPELLERYGVSRAVFREAVRLVEHQQLARMRRGPGGGLVVSIPTVESVMDAFTIYLFYMRVEIDEVFEARLALEETVAELAPARVGETDIDALRGLLAREREGTVEDNRELHALLASITGNPALEFFVELLNQATAPYVDEPARVGSTARVESAHAHAAIAESVLAGNDGLARHRMRKHLEAEAAYLRRARGSHRKLGAPVAAGRREKRAQTVARQIFAEVVAAGWPVGDLLGSEAELMERYEVSRAVLREAVRVLEHHQVARMRRGPGGGLFVAEPGAAAITEAVALHLDRRGITPADLFEVRGAVEMAILELVVGHLDEGGAAQLQHALDTEGSASRESFPDIGHDLHAVLADVAGNRVLTLLALVLIRLTRIHQASPPGAPDPLPTKEVHRVHQRIVEAVLARDLELARFRLRRHLDALSNWVQ